MLIQVAPPAVVAEHLARMAGAQPATGARSAAAGTGQRSAGKTEDVIDADYRVVR